MAVVWVLTTRVFRCSRGVSTALLFASTHKSLTLGIPLIDVLFPVASSITAIPVLICHPIQILGGGVLVGPLARWNEQQAASAVAGGGGGGAAAAAGAGAGGIGSSAPAFAARSVPRLGLGGAFCCWWWRW